MMIPITHVIFDLDGTLIDSEKHLFQSTNDVLNEFGKTFDWNIRSKTLGLHLQKSAPIIIEHFNLSIEPIDYIDKVLLRFKSYVQGDNGGYGIQLLPGVKRLVTHLSRHNIPMAICTGCKEDTFRYKVRLPKKHSNNFIIFVSFPPLSPHRHNHLVIFFVREIYFIIL